MATATLRRLGERLRKERGGRGLREVAREIGVSAATLSRVERGHLPDLETFGKICAWLGLDPGDVLGVQVEKAIADVHDDPITASIHFKANRTPAPELAKALAEMIIYTEKTLKRQGSQRPT
ncbi:MAG: helix-turn-helix transcriptional regulator [Dehalococcoidia bacterium]